MKIKYCGSAGDYSGYGEANRHDIAALIMAGVNVTTQIPRYTLEVADFGKIGNLARDNEGKPIGYQIKIIHLTPNLFRTYMEPGKYHIGRVFWETDKLPLEFATGTQLMDEIWTGSQYNADAIRKAGVTKPIYIIPEAIDTEMVKPSPYLVKNYDDYKFYSIFEWTARKNPEKLLEAYWREFEKDQGVSLTLKTYIDNFQDKKKKDLLQVIRKLKLRLKLKKYPPTYIFTRLLNRSAMYKFHQTFDCLVSAHRGEGWGIPQMEALLLEKPVISTNCGGIHEYLKHKENACLLPYTLTAVNNDRNVNWYSADQKWAEVSIKELRACMRWVFDNRQEAEKMGIAGSKLVIDNFSLKTVGAMMLERLRKVQYEMNSKEVVQ